MKNQILKTSLTAIAFLLAIAVFSQNENHNSLSLDSFYSKIKSQKNPQIVDARTSEEFALNHIEGSRPVSRSPSSLLI